MLPILSLLLLVPTAGPLYGGPPEDQKSVKVCASETLGARAVTAAEKIDACTKLIDAKGAASRRMALFHIYRANGYVAIKDTARSIADLEQAVKADPTYSYAWAKLCSSTNWFLKDRPKALGQCNAALKLNPKDPGALTHRGDVYLAMRQYALAEEDYNASIAGRRDWMWPWSNRGIARRRSGQSQAAIRDFDHVIRLSPDFAEGYVQRGVTRLKLNDVVGALVDFEKGLKVDPDCATCLYFRGLARKKNGDAAAGAEDIAAALAKDAFAISEYDDDGLKP